MEIREIHDKMEVKMLIEKLRFILIFLMEIREIQDKMEVKMFNEYPAGTRRCCDAESTSLTLI